MAEEPQFPDIPDILRAYSFLTGLRGN